MAQTGTAIYPAQPTTITFAGSFPGTQAIPGGSEFSGQALVPENSLYPGASSFAGQGEAPLLQVLLSFDDVTVPTPVWTYVADNKVRSFSVSRGRDSELTEFDTGNARVTLDNRNRAYDPTSNSSIRPMNQLWLREQFSGETHDLFKGYVEIWDQQWPGGGWSDAIVEVSAADEVKILSLDALPNTDPPRDDYFGLVSSDAPEGYWRLNVNPTIQIQPPADVVPNPPLLLGPTIFVGGLKTPPTGKGWQ